MTAPQTSLTDPIRALRAAGWPVPAIARATGLSVRSMEKWAGGQPCRVYGAVAKVRALLGTDPGPYLVPLGGARVPGSSKRNTGLSNETGLTSGRKP